MTSCCYKRKFSSLSLKETRLEKEWGKKEGEEEEDEVGDGGREGGGTSIEDGWTSMDQKTIPWKVLDPRKIMNEL